MALDIDGAGFKARIATLGDNASIEEAIRVYHYGIDNFESNPNQPLRTSPPVGIAAHFQKFTDDITAINAELDSLPGIYVEQVSLTASPNVITAQAPGITPLRIDAIASQTAPLISFFSSTSVELGKITAAGTLDILANLKANSTLATSPSIDDNTTKIATTAWVLGQVSGTNPLMNGSANVGTSLRFARSDHVHPSDTSKLDSSTTSTQSGYFGDIFLYDDTTPSHYLQITNSANLTALRTLSINVNDGSRVLSLTGDLNTVGGNSLTLTTSGATNVTLPTSGTIAVVGNPLSQFAATTSAQLAGVISDEVGTDKLVFNTSPTFVTSLITSSASFDLFNTTATTLNFAGAATSLTIGATTGTATIRNASTVVTGDLAVNGGDITTSAASFNLVNATATTVNIAGAGTTVSIGAATGTTTINNANTVVTGDLAINGGDVTTSATTFNLVDATVTTLNLAGAATSVTIGATTGTATIRNANTAITGDLAVNGGDLTSSAATFNLLDATVTTLNFARAGTAITIGATTGTTTIRNANTVITGDLAVNGGDITSSSATVNLFTSTATAINIGSGSADVTIPGDLFVTGTTTYTNVASLDVVGMTIKVGQGSGVADNNKDRGVVFEYNSAGLKTGFFGFDDSTGKFTFVPDATITSDVVSGTKGTLDANIEWADVLNKPDPVVTVTLTGDVTGTGNATLTDLGNGTISFATTIAADSVALGTDTTGNYIATGAVSGNGLSGSATGEGSTFTVTSNATNLNTASTIVFRDASGNFSAGTITAALSGNATSATNATNVGITDDITTNATMYPTWVTATTGNLPQRTSSTKLTFNPSTGTLTATTFSGALSGNATTATTLQNARTINGTSFNGSANITTTSWGTSRTLTVGSTGKAVDGSTNIAWTLSEIGVNDATLTMAVSGTGLSISATPTFTANASVNKTITVTSNATDANTASAIVARDASGNFSANSATFASTVTAATPTASTHLATKGYVDTVTVNNRTASYVLVLSDAGKVIEMDVASPNTVTIPSNDTAFPIGTTIDVVQVGDGQTTLVPDAGVTIQSSEGLLSLAGKFSAVSLYKRAANTWIAMGDLS